MKRCLMLLVAMLLVAGLLPQTPINAQTDGDFPYEGIYLTDENRIIQGFVFDEDYIRILLRKDNEIDGETKNLERYHELLNANRGLDGLIVPTMDAEEVEKWREENLSFPDYAQIYAEVAEQITPDMTRQEIDALIDAQDPHIDYAYVQYNFNNPLPMLFITLHAPTIERSQDLWIVKIQSQRLLRFEYEENADGETITDDFGVIYTKTDEYP